MLFTHLCVINKQEELFLNNIGDTLKYFRVQKKMSQEDLANDADIPINQIGRIERAEINTSLLTILKITNALEISFLDFFQELENLSKTKTQD
ncbi:hypothetical protein LPB136_09485 [Tenacibaculum todarodis]|uniref:HTH cro/C1-type domain-containing protein n=1 Tax=Tenacibaculum todarodis TaxID=1850252 RepID=A0A1L3JKC6_9FLAO|nr:hypothetical protein LPB136_09485 [Tenacibaculum todarodis]